MYKEDYLMLIDSQTSLHLASIKKSVQECTLCPLVETRTNIVFGAGNEHANVVLCGEAPGKNEDESGLPFVGAAGKRLDALLAIAGLERDDIFIANVLKCRPPRNRDPKPAEIKACSPYLAAQIEAIKPKILVTLGTFSSQFVLNTKRPITELRGNFFTQAGPFLEGSGGADSHPSSKETQGYVHSEKRTQKEGRFKEYTQTGRRSEEHTQEERSSERRMQKGESSTASKAQDERMQSNRIVTVFPVFHPAAAIYDPKKQSILEEDFKNLRAWLKEH